jgi:hypothetical protein
MRGLLSAFRRSREPAGDDADRALAHGNALVEQGRLLDAIDAFVEANRLRPDAEIERRLVRLRGAAFEQLDRAPRALPGGPAVEPAAVDEPSFITPDRLTPATLREGILRHGSVWVRGLVPPPLVRRLRNVIDTAFDAYDATAAGCATPATSRWYDPIEVIGPPFARDWRRQANAVLTADSPRALFELLEVMHTLGLDRLLASFFGERPSLAAEKCTLFRVHSKEWRLRLADWHQDGAFLGDGVRTINCWYALTRCGRDAPGMDIIPRRIERILPIGEEGCHFDWTISPNTVARAFPGVPRWRPEFHEGDVLLFDELAVHRTAADEDMPNVRYAIESWTFASSVYPTANSTPLVI